MRPALFIILIFWFRLIMPDPVQGNAQEVSPADYDSLNPAILSVINAIQADSIRATMIHLQNYGSRYKLNENRKSVAGWLASRFISYGYTDVALDSFYCHVTRPVDTLLWQYNVMAKLPGLSAPDEEDLVGAHYDSYSNANPSSTAPGADDNASGVAAVLEIARVMKEQGFQPETTITFALFAAEELGGQGSEQMAREARETGRDIRIMLNLDMIASDPDSMETIEAYSFYRVESAAEFAAGVFSDYTGFTVETPADSTNTGSDSYFFWLYGFPVTFFIEKEFSPNWHTPFDTLGACNLGYCRDVTRGACAILMEDQELPYPRSFTAHSANDQITLSWLPTTNRHVAGFNLYRSKTSDAGFTWLDSVAGDDSLYVDQTVGKGQEFFYLAKTFDESDRESYSSETARGVRMDFSDTLLVVNSVADNTSTPDEIYRFYERILDTVPFTWVDVNRQHPLSLHQLGTHRNVWWMANHFNYTPMLHPSTSELGDFFTNGGNMLLTAFLPAKLMDGITDNVSGLSDGSVLRSYFKADSLIRKPTGLFCGALPVTQGYDTLQVSTETVIMPGFPGELPNVETYLPLPQGTVIYRYDSHYPSGSPQGMLKGKPVGMEYIGNDYRTILLSFPLFCMDTLDAKLFITEVLKNKFTHPVGFRDSPTEENFTDVKVFPNPSKDWVTVEFSVRRPEVMEITLYNSTGILLTTLYSGVRLPGKHRFTFAGDRWPTGIYSVELKSPTSRIVKKLIHLH